MCYSCAWSKFVGILQHAHRASKAYDLTLLSCVSWLDTTKLVWFKAQKPNRVKKRMVWDIRGFKAQKPNGVKRRMVWGIGGATR